MVKKKTKFAKLIIKLKQKFKKRKTKRKSVKTKAIEIVINTAASLEKQRQQELWKQNSVMYKLFLNIKTYLTTHIVSKLKNLISKLKMFLLQVEIQELRTPIKYVIGYGLLGWPVLYTFFEYNFKFMYIIGAGAGIYLMYDILSFLKEMVIDILNKKGKK